MRGIFVTFEGGEGLGKSTQAKLLAERLRDAGRDVVLSREPGGTELGQELRQVLLHREEPLSRSAELLLMCADRAQHVEQTILPALQAGAVVVCDRYVDSTFAYQGYGREWSLDTLKHLHEIAIGDLFPDLTFVLEGEPHRLPGDDRFERLGSDFHARVRRGYSELLSTATQYLRIHPERFVSVNANQDASTISEIVWRHVSARL